MLEALAFLGLTAEASEHEIRAAYLAACRRIHPDTGNGDLASWERLQVARAVLEATKNERTKCLVCKGSKVEKILGGNWNVLITTCRTCKGSGRKP